MSLNLVLEAMQRLPSANFALIVIMAFAAGFMVNQILRIGFVATMASIPVLLFFGALGNVILMTNQVTLSPDKASNTALSACFGFILFAMMIFAAVRVWNQIRDRR